MSQIGVLVNATEVPPVQLVPFNTANAFFVGFADWGPTGISGTASATTSQAQAVAQIGGPNLGPITVSRTATNATLYDATDVFFREAGTAAQGLYFARVVGPTPVNATLALQDTGAGTALTINALYVGAGGNSIHVTVVNNSTNYTITLTDPNGIVLAASPTLTNTNKADAIAWALTTGLITITAGTALLPATLASTPLASGSDDAVHATLTNWTNALSTAFPLSLGPGQVCAPGITNTTVSGIWAALAGHAQTNNRIALLDVGDGLTATAATSAVTSANISGQLGSYIGYWAGFLQVPGIVPGTTRVVAPSPVIAALCARVDATGNPNLAAAGQTFALQYVSGLNTTYTGALGGDIATLNSAGINAFVLRFGLLENYGFVSGILPTADAIYWQLDHGRLRMALLAQGAFVGEPFVFSQLDGQGSTATAFGSALTSMLTDFYNAGALFGATPTDAFSVDTSSDVNPPASLQAGQLNAVCQVRMSPYAQLVTITFNAVSITQTLPTAAAAVAAGGVGG